MDSVIDLKSKEIKRATLNELVEYVSTNRGVLVETAYPEITSMVSTLMCDVMSYLSGVLCDDTKDVITNIQYIFLCVANGNVCGSA